MEDQARVEAAKMNLRMSIGLPDEENRIVYGMCMTFSKKTTASSWKFLITNSTGQIRDITGYIALAIGHKWNDKKGTISIRGGNGLDVINSLGLVLFNNHDSIQYQSL